MDRSVSVSLVIALVLFGTTTQGCTQPSVAEDGQPFASGSGSGSGAGAMIIEAETADAEALARLGDWSALPLLATDRYEEQSSRDRGSFDVDEATWLPEFAYGNRDMDNFVCKSADAQLGSGNFLSFRFDREQCEESYVQGAVMARFEGSGTLRRLWMTAASLSEQARFASEVLRIYVDDEPRPLLQVPLQQVLDGTAAEIFAPPFGAGSSRFIAWYYPVVFAKKLVVAIDQLSTDYYYQVDVQHDAAPSARKAATSRLPERDRALALLNAGSPLSAADQPLARTAVELPPRGISETRIAGPSTIEGARLRVKQAALRSLDPVRLRVFWDDSTAPAIDLQVLALFAAGRRVVERNALALAADSDGDDQLLELRLPMPFRRSATWVLENLGADAASFELTWLGREGVPARDFGTLSTQVVELPLPSVELEHPLALVNGRGHYIGMCADLAGHADLDFAIADPLNLLEGDVRASADGLIALDGTGTEDYPDNSFYFKDSPKATPFAQNWGLEPGLLLSLPGQVSFCRWQVLGNELDFQSSFVATFEIALRDATVVELHRTVAFLYLQ